VEKSALKLSHPVKHVKTILALTVKQSSEITELKAKNIFII